MAKRKKKQIEINDKAAAGAIRDILADAEKQITGKKQGSKRKQWAINQLADVIALPAFLPKTMKRMLLGLVVEIVFHLATKSVEAIGDAVEKKGEKKDEPKK